MKSPIVSVIVPTYNRGDLISKCIRSLLDQSIDPDKYEIIVIDDCSEDQTMEILKNFKEKIKILKNSKNMGLPYSLNKGIKNALGRFIVRVDSDDYVTKEYLQILSLHLLLDDKIDAVCCDYFLVDGTEEHLERINFDDHPIGCCIMFRIDQLIKIGLYDEEMLFREDKDLLIRFKDKFKIYRCPLPLYRYFQHDKNMSKNYSKMNEYENKIKKKMNLK